MIWGFKSCNFVHSANARLFVSNFPAAPILNYDVCWPQQKLCIEKWRLKKPLASSRNTRAIISQSQARMRCNSVRMSPKDVQSLTGGSLRKDWFQHDLIKKKIEWTLLLQTSREIDKLCCCSHWEFRTSEMHHRPLWFYSCLTERDSAKNNINSLKNYFRDTAKP